MCIWLRTHKTAAMVFASAVAHTINRPAPLLGWELITIGQLASKKKEPEAPFDPWFILWSDDGHEMGSKLFVALTMGPSTKKWLTDIIYDPHTPNQTIPNKTTTKRTKETNQTKAECIYISDLKSMAFRAWFKKSPPPCDQFLFLFVQSAKLCTVQNYAKL